MFTRLAQALAIAWLGVIACKSEQASETQAPVAEKKSEDKLVVFAATSLRDAFNNMGETFRASHPGVELTFNFAGTQELRTQLEQGAAVDVFASADQKHMGELVKAGRASAPQLFARNEPVIVVAQEATQSIHGLADLPAASRLVIGTAEVPIGRYTLQILDKAAAGPLGADFRSKVEAKVVSRELNVRQVLTKVKLGEAEAGFVYRTDAKSTPELTVLTIPAELNVIAEYPIAVVHGAQHPALAKAWVDFVRSEPGKNVLQTAGFLPP
ncbi:MAG TPA: molybdate ABC transporter substrate-binding protein [Polyangiales bacterium]|nr:molybdate ABC transporter substrate-binding protein [Polyangiales bacterium]